MPTTHDSKPLLFTRGPLIVSLESCFWHLQRYPRAKLVGRRQPFSETARPREVEDPYRKGHGRVFRLPGTRWALVVGYWEPAGEAVLEDEQNDKLLEAVEGAHIPGITATEIAEWTPARDVASWWRRLVERWQLMRRVKRGEAVVLDDGLVIDDSQRLAWEDEWTVVPWDDSVIDFEDTRTHPGAPDGVA